MLPCAYWRVRCTCPCRRQAFGVCTHVPDILPTPRVDWHVICTRLCSQHTLVGALHALDAPHHSPASTCPPESRHVSPSLCHLSSKKKIKYDPDPIFFGPIQRVRTGSSQVGQTFNRSRGFGLLGPFKLAHSNRV
jgi:hypothetical protein